MNRFWIRDVGTSALVTISVFVTIVGAGYLGLHKAVQVALMFGVPGAFLLAQLPSSLLYALFPNGGGLGFMGLAALGAILQLFLVVLAVLRYRRRRSPKAARSDQTE